MLVCPRLAVSGALGRDDAQLGAVPPTGRPTSAQAPRPPLHPHPARVAGRSPVSKLVASQMVPAVASLLTDDQRWTFVTPIWILLAGGVLARASPSSSASFVERRTGAPSIAGSIHGVEGFCLRGGRY